MSMCRRGARRSSHKGAAIINSYLVLLFLLVHFKIVRFNLFWKLSPFLVILAVLFGLLVPMGWGAPQGSARRGPQFGGDRA